jgi:hypothetical protein
MTPNDQHLAATIPVFCMMLVCSCHYCYRRVYCCHRIRWCAVNTEGLAPLAVSGAAAGSSQQQCHCNLELVCITSSIILDVSETAAVLYTLSCCLPGSLELESIINRQASKRNQV